MLVLFNNIPVPDLCHRPILPIMPPQVNLTTDVLPGCHKGAQLFTVSKNIEPKDELKPTNIYSTITFHYVTRFLRGCGTTFNEI
jgi:hypothetical protein